jgi:chemotaxis family two-component system response regulator PixG
VSITQSSSYTDLLENLKTCSRLQFNGKLNIQNQQGEHWQFYYRLGRIVCGLGGEHPVRRWRRQMVKHCPLVKLDNCQFRSRDLEVDDWDYQVLRILRQRQEVNTEQIAAMVEGIIAELVFDVTQQATIASLQYERDEKSIIESPLTLSRRGHFIKQLEQEWSKWNNAGITTISPNLAPRIVNKEKLQQAVNPKVYKNFIVLLNSKLTLRDLAIKLKQDPCQLTRSLFPYVQKGLVELVTVSDVKMPSAYDQVPPDGHHPERRDRSPLIACVDDSPQVCHLVEQIIISQGYRCLSLSDPLTALPKLIEAKPDLVFLDLIMPVANGYEICSQLRRISAFKEIPILILTGNDGFVDRVRAKLVGASSYLTKPIEAKTLIETIQKHLVGETQYAAPTSSQPRSKS